MSRLRLGRVLGGAELRPPGLPPSAVLCVRRVLDPLPGALRLDGTDVRPPPEWERGFVDALERALRTAARPAREHVPAGAEAVLFADEAELLACLARDARDGTAWTRWWWRSLRQSARPGEDPVVEAWLEQPEHAPAALELLAARGEAVGFVAALPRAAASALAERVAAAFGAAELRAAIAAAASPSLVDDVEASVPPVRAATVRRPPPWRALVRETEERTLAPERELLLGVALALRRAPAVARSTPFAGAVRAWRAAPAAPRPEKPAAAIRAARVAAVETAQPERASASPVERPAAPPEPRRAAPRRASPVAEPHAHVAAPRAPEQRPAAQPRRLDAPAGGRIAPRAPEGDVAEPMRGEPVGPVASPPAHDSDPPQRLRLRTPPPPRARTRRRARARQSQVRAQVAAVVPPEPAETIDAPPARIVVTELGGVFYLLNLALFLGLYGDFTTPLSPGLALDPWDFLSLLAPRLLDARAPHDPLWRLLADLAAPRRFRAPRAWRVPRAWLAPFDEDGEWRWSAARGTLRVVHPAGFPVVAVPRNAEPPRAQLARELRRLRVQPRRRALRPEPTEQLARWTARVAAYADARLRVALALAADASLERVLLRRRARIFVTPTHVDVVLRLAELPLEVRLAGLDRTPGWLPAAGRFVALHFE